MVPFERALVSSCRPSIVTFPLSLRISEILSLLCSSTPLFPTPSLVTPNFTMFPGETYVLLIHQRYRRTHRRTDGRHAIAIPRFSASRGKISAGAQPRTLWGSLRRSPDPLVGWGGGIPVHTRPVRRLRRLDSRYRLGAYNASVLRPHQ